MRWCRIIQKRNFNKEDLAVSPVIAILLMTCVTTSAFSVIPIYMSSMPDFAFELDDPTSIGNGETPVSEFVPLEILDIDPDALYLAGQGKSVTCYVQLPDEYDVQDINCETILLNYVVSGGQTDIGDYDYDGVSDLMVKFDRDEVVDILEPGDNVELTITLELIDGRQVMGTDYIKVM